MTDNENGASAQLNSPEADLDESFPRRGMRDALLDRFGNYPLLRMLICQPWFRLVFVLVGLTVLAAAASIPKLWTVTPEGFRPAVTVSLVDLVQARTLARSAREFAAAGREDDAARSWQAAVANDPSDVEFHREALRQMLRSEQFGQKHAVQAVSEAVWLLRLTQTNVADLDLVTQVYDRVGAAEDLYSLLYPYRKNLTDAQLGPYLKATFQAGNMQEFGAAWERAGGRFDRDPELALFHAAYLAGWGPIDRTEEGRLRLDAAARDPATWIAAARLQLAVCAKRIDADQYGEILTRLEEARMDRLVDRLGYWTLLDMVGRRGQALALAEQYSLPPRFPWEAMQLTGAYLRLGLDAKAIELLRRCAPRFGPQWGQWGTALWLGQCDLLTANERWHDLLDVAMQMRHIEPLRLEVSGFIAFIEGRARHALGHTDLAQTAMAAAATGEYPAPPVALQAATIMKRLGYLLPARDLLARLEPAIESEPTYWRTVLEVTDQLRQDAVLLLKAASRGRQLAPGDRSWEADYCVALLINRQTPAEAVQLTLRLLEAEPNRVEWKVHHAWALALNQRVDEAESLLQNVNQLELNDLGVTLYHLAAFEVHCHRKHYAQARSALERISRRHLFPCQVQWLDAMRAKMPAAPASS